MLMEKLSFVKRNSDKMKLIIFGILQKIQDKDARFVYNKSA